MATAADVRVGHALAYLELEASDSGIRSLVGVQGSLATFAIWEHGTPEQSRSGSLALSHGTAVENLRHW
jgi:glutaryl-CoA dehydrogenase